MHVNILIQSVKDNHKSVNGEAVELRLANTRKVGGGDAGQFFGFTYRQYAVVEDADDLGGQQRFQLLNCRV